MPSGNVSTTTTGSNTTSPVFVTVIVNVTSVEDAPLEGLAIFSTSIHGAIMVTVTSAESLSVTGSPVGGWPVASTQLIIVPDASLSA